MLQEFENCFKKLCTTDKLREINPDGKMDRNNYRMEKKNTPSLKYCKRTKKGGQILCCPY